MVLAFLICAMRLNLGFASWVHDQRVLAAIYGTVHESHALFSRLLLQQV